MAEAALGFADHSGWAVAVAIVQDGAWFEVIARERVELVEGDIPRQPYHAVAERGWPREIIGRAATAAAALAGDAMARLCTDLRAAGHEPVAASVPVGSAPDPSNLDAILSSHMRFHAAEGNLFREALAEGAASTGLRVFRAPRGDVPALAAGASGLTEPEFTARLAAMRHALGAPWQADQKLAAALAWLALAPAA